MPETGVPYKPDTTAELWRLVEWASGLITDAGNISEDGWKDAAVKWREAYVALPPRPPVTKAVADDNYREKYMRLSALIKALRLTLDSVHLIEEAVDGQ